MVAGYSPNSGAAGGLAGGLASAFTPVGRSGSVGFTGTSLLPAPGGSGLKGGFGGDPGDHRHAASFAHAMQTDDSCCVASFAPSVRSQVVTASVRGSRLYVLLRYADSGR